MQWFWTCPLAVVVIFVALLPSGEGIICYQCKSWEDPGCYNVKQNDTRNAYAKFCDSDEIPPGVGIFCRTIHQKIRDGNGTERLWRKCGWEEYKSKSGKACYQNSDGHHEETVCQCFFDYCNAAATLALSPVFVPAALAAAALAVLRAS